MDPEGLLFNVINITNANKIIKKQGACWLPVTAVIHMDNNGANPPNNVTPKLYPIENPLAQLFVGKSSVQNADSGPIQLAAKVDNNMRIKQIIKI